MPTTIYQITSITQSGGSANYDYVIDLQSNFTGTFTYGPAVINDKDDLFEGGEQLFYTIGSTVYIVSYDGFVEVNATGSVDFGVITIDSVYSVNGDTNVTTDTVGIVGLQFGFTTDSQVPDQGNRASLPDPAVGTQIIGLVCFASGTLIKTNQGLRAIETLRTGDLLETLDSGHQPIRWIGRRKLNAGELILKPHLRPIRISAGALGPSAPNRDLLVSPQHRILVRSRIALRMFETSEVFVAAKHLLGIPGIDIASDVHNVTYYHVMCDEHEIVEAEGALAETLYTGSEALKAMSPEAEQEITEIFGEMPFLNRPLARTTPKGRLAKKLVERHVKNQKCLLAEASCPQS